MNIACLFARRIPLVRIIINCAQHLVSLAKANNVDYRVDIYPYYGSDASAAIRAGFDVVHGLIGPGIDASHAFERTHITSLKHTAHLLALYLQSKLV